MSKFQIIEDAKRQARMLFLGIAIPHQPSLAKGVYGPIKSEKILKFNRKTLRKGKATKMVKNDTRYKGGDDLMIVKVGKPGSRERVEALRAFYELHNVAGQEISAFHDE